MRTNTWKIRYFRNYLERVFVASVEESRGFASARQITVRDGRFTTRYNFERDSRLANYSISSTDAPFSMTRTFYYPTSSNRVVGVIDRIETSSQNRTINTQIHYHPCGNIHSVVRGGVVTRFYYDSAGRLIRETGPLGEFHHSYDSLNNIITEETMNVYDEIGNPIRYGGWLMEWTRGRLLSRITPSRGDGAGWEFHYDENGIRYRKVEWLHTNPWAGGGGLIVAPPAIGPPVIVNETIFFKDGTKLIAQECWQNGFIEFFHDAQGVVGMRVHNNAPTDRNFFFIRDIFGNIVEIINERGQTVATYYYDAWGNHVVGVNVGGIAYVNPFRYRGKYFDQGTGFYYLNTRFYDPSARRFINADNYLLLPLLAQRMGGVNLFAYANNNPVRYVDPTGQSAVLL